MCKVHLLLGYRLLAQCIFLKAIFISGNVLHGRKTRKQHKGSDSDEKADDLPHKDLDTNEKPTG